jgi:hypothetical protein
MVFAVTQSSRVQWNTISGYIIAIRQLHVLHLGRVPWDGGLRLPQLLAGIHRRQMCSPQRRAPVTLALLAYWRTRLNLSCPAHRSLWAALLLAFYGLLRKSEFTSPSASAFDPQTHLTRRRVRFCRDPSGSIISMDVHVRFSKTHQYGNEVPIPFARLGGDCCPVEAMLAHLGSASTDDFLGELPLFSNDHGTALSAPEFSRALRELVDSTPTLAPDVRLTAHSLRIGGAMSLFEAGAPDGVIQMAGRWRGMSFTDYLRFSRETVLHWNRRVGALTGPGLGAYQVGGTSHGSARRRPVPR